MRIPIFLILALPCLLLKAKAQPYSAQGLIVGRRQTLYTLDLEASKLKDEAVYIEDRRFSKQAPNYYRMDIRVSYRKNNPNAFHIIFLDIQNVINCLNVYSRYYDDDKQEIATSYKSELIPILNYRIEC